MRAKSMKVAGVFNLDVVAMLSSQVEELKKKIDVMQCDVNEVGMINSKCLPFNSCTENEQVNFMGNNSRPQNNHYSNSYNTGWSNNPNFSWGVKGDSPLRDFNNLINSRRN
ncbi:biogenesis of lysosome-related organelles complex 1 subunit 2-like [Gossypium australe]|uniref:Biogenesis of lysosome-related organelles complex 1 subunit 2-like n=1 Tax=Gossypium australe TaxID=47621 RepID=A0A5B6VYV9_9ROSI|nr:biogenesis of lysosome-related organelles complex 1 subunit 2-like [Gossypium australe]